MSKKSFILIVLFIILLIFGAVIWKKSYPIILVGSNIITAKNFNEDFSASLNYYEQNQKIYGGDSQLLQSEEVKNEIKRALLTSLIEDILIDKELRKEMNSEDLARLVINKIGDIKQGENAEKAAKILYGFSYDVFKQKILEPMAKKEILEGRLYLNDKNIDEYLEKIKSKTKIIILLPEFDWNGKEVIIKK